MTLYKEQAETLSLLFLPMKTVLKIVCLQLVLVLLALREIAMATDTNPISCEVVCMLEFCLPVIAEDCDGEIRENATFCGCCPNCIRYLDKGRACGDYKLQFPRVPTTMCRPPLECRDGHCSEPFMHRGMRPPVFQYAEDTAAKQRAIAKAELAQLLAT